MVVTIGKYEYRVPTSWNELTREQLLEVHRAFERTEDPQATLFRLLKILTGMSWWRFVFTPSWILDEFTYLTHFLVSDTDFTKQLLPKYRGLYGPTDNFRNLVMCEFANTEYYYMEWDRQLKDKGTADEALLDNLVAILYRPAKKGYDLRRNPDGDPRVAFNENLCTWSAERKVKRWPTHVKMAIAAWYAGCREQLVKDNPAVFSGGGEEARYGLLSVIRSVAEKGVHGDFDKVQAKPVYLIMVELNEMVHEARNQPQLPTL